MTNPRPPTGIRPIGPIRPIGLPSVAIAKEGPIRPIRPIFPQVIPTIRDPARRENPRLKKHKVGLRRLQVAPRSIGVIPDSRCLPEEFTISSPILLSKRALDFVLRTLAENGGEMGRKEIIERGKVEKISERSTCRALKEGLESGQLSKGRIGKQIVYSYHCQDVCLI